ncbi:MAG: hypothetical protein RLZZ231_410 [Bacteroidota bacterium]|jgi:hypothetical protein
MINPSIFGWIDKFFIEQNQFDLTDDVHLFYKNIRNTGFVYGHIVQFPFKNNYPIENWKSEEISKVAFLSVLYEVYLFVKRDPDSSKFIHQVTHFYDEIHPKNSFAFNFGKISDAQKLEDIIGVRIKTNKDIISKNFSPIVTNALLFVDVLAFQKYLMEGTIPENYVKKIEALILNIVTYSLSVKSSKSENDALLIQLFETSTRYTKFENISKFASIDDLPLHNITDPLEKYYLLDLAGLSLWSDGKIDDEEQVFLAKLAEKLEVSNVYVKESIESIDAFIRKYKSEIQYFNHSNPVKHFYEQTSNNVEVLVKRNKTRLTKELAESKELMSLLAQSTLRDLNKDEKKKVKKQLLDICKSIPSLTIFLLPGGGLLLPLLIKFIPQLLPSAFNENLED